jgi:hypothetical protein
VGENSPPVLRTVWTLTQGVVVVIRFQLLSTVRMVAWKGVPAVCGEGVPALPAAEPGTAVSPGSSSCRRTVAVSARTCGTVTVCGRRNPPLAVDNVMSMLTMAVRGVHAVKLLMPWNSPTFAGGPAGGSVSHGSAVSNVTTCAAAVSRLELSSTARAVNR